MLQLISLICCVVLLVLTPIQMRKLRAGVVPPKFKGDAAAYRAVYRKQLTMLVWLGTVFGVLSIAMGILDLSGINEDTAPVEGYVQFGVAAIWLAVAISMSVHRRRLDSWPAQGAPHDTVSAA